MSAVFYVFYFATLAVALVTFIVLDKRFKVKVKRNQLCLCFALGITVLMIFSL